MAHNRTTYCCIEGDKHRLSLVVRDEKDERFGVATHYMDLI
jgi:hypothetical protein